MYIHVDQKDTSQNFTLNNLFILFNKILKHKNNPDPIFQIKKKKKKRNTIKN